MHLFVYNYLFLIRHLGVDFDVFSHHQVGIYSELNI